MTVPPTPMIMPAERYITADELAEAMGVSRTTIKRWVRAGAPSETWGMRVRRFRLTDVQAWAREQPFTLMTSPAAHDTAGPLPRRR